MLIRQHESLVLLIDVQQKLMPHIHHHQQVSENCNWVLRLANELQIPILASEQYPKGLGTTLEVLRQHISPAHIQEKIEFSACANADCFEKITKANKKQIIVMGIEAHVCVLQTVLELLDVDKEVFVIAEAIGSRDEADKLLALQRMRKAGAEIVSKEMVFFEWLRSKQHPQFKELTQIFMK